MQVLAIFFLIPQQVCVSCSFLSGHRTPAMGASRILNSEVLLAK